MSVAYSVSVVIKWSFRYIKYKAKKFSQFLNVMTIGFIN